MAVGAASATSVIKFDHRVLVALVHMSEVTVVVSCGSACDKLVQATYSQRGDDRKVSAGGCDVGWRLGTLHRAKDADSWTEAAAGGRYPDRLELGVCTGRSIYRSR